MFMAANDAQEIQFVMNQIRNGRILEDHHFVVVFDQAENESAVDNAQQIENEKRKAIVKALSLFRIAAMETDHLGRHQMYNCRQIIGVLMWKAPLSRRIYRIRQIQMFDHTFDDQFEQEPRICHAQFG